MVFGITRVTLPYALRQLASLVEITFFVVYIAVTLWTVEEGTFHVIPFWLAVSTLFMAERIISVRKAGMGSMLLASTMIIETLYGLWKHVVNLTSAASILTGRKARW